ncbi:MAG: TIGR04282 family arsenosugar biosynthesis glycosyltransferase [Flavobacteriaceae bacterium]
MGIILSKEQKNEAATINYHNIVSKNLLLIFTRNPELGKCKTRLAVTVGNENALAIYQFLLGHTVAITKETEAAKQVWYSEEIWANDIWANTIYEKRLQVGHHLGERMANAFQSAFASGYERVIIIGSDMYDLNRSDIENAFTMLNKTDFVIGPATDGGYYLLGMKTFKPELFEHKNWGSATVLEMTLNDLKNENIHLLDARNDVDVYDDIKDIAAFQPYLKNI